MALILTTSERIVSPAPKLSSSPILCCISNDAHEISLAGRLKSDNENRVILVDAISAALNVVDQGDTGVVLLGREYIVEITAEMIAEFKKRTPEISLLLFVDSDETDENLLRFYSTGIVDTIQVKTDYRLIQKKIEMYMALHQQRKELNKVNDRLQKANQQLEEYVYIVSHDLKAPLRGLASLADFIREEVGDNPSAVLQEMLGLMQSRTERMQQMIDGILHYSRMSSNCGEKEDVNVKELINNIIDLINPDREVRFEFSDQLPVLHCEKIKIQEVFQNLILNSIKHNDNQEVKVKITCRDAGSHFYFSVSDNGKGIKPEHREKIFGFFQTLLPKDKSGGTGLGLTIVKKIVEQQEGHVSLESEIGKGSTFSFTWMK